ncbi:MAG: D-glycero-beta-D-manno-heptose-7-phosphate kinase [Gemmatimonadetes bacterium]|nr:MAG: D-glycero-beta-D-manno-heptose-7-phosphate kinase [Gemmatimonadota bacterium]
MNRTTAQRILAEFKQKKVIVIGDVMIDEYIWGDVHRISPEAPVPVIEMQGTTVRLGGAANVAHNIAALGATPILIGIIGDDDGARMLIDCVTENQMSAAYLISDASRPTTRKTRVIAHQQQVVRIDRESTNPISETVRQDVLAQFEAQIQDADAVLIQDYNKGLLTPDLIASIIQKARDAGCFISVDPKFENFFAYKGVNLFKPNLREAETMLGMKIRENQDVNQMGRRLLEQLECDMVLLTQGPNGMTLFEGENFITYIPTVAREVFDVSGAGDTVIATTTLGLTTHATPVEAAVLATHAAGIVIGKVGIAPIQWEELQQTFSEDDNGD